MGYREEPVDSESGEGSSRADRTALHVMGWQQKDPRVRTYAALSLTLAITNIFTLGLWFSSLYRMNSWLMEDYYNRPKIEYLGQAQIPVQLETRRFHTGIVAGDKELSTPSSSTVDLSWSKVVEVGLTRLTTAQAYHLGEETSKEWNRDDSYVGVLSAFHQLHCLSRLRYAILYPGRLETSDEDHRARKHTFHCIEYLREIIMCLGDVTVEPVGWNATTLTYIAEKDQVRQCRRFDKIYEWATEDVNQVPNAPGNEKAWKAMLDFESAHPVDRT